MPTWMPMALRFGTCTGKCRVGRDEIAGFGVRWRWGRGCGGRAGGRAHATARRAAGAVRCEATTAAVAGAVRCVPCAAARAGGRGKVPTMPEPRGLKSRPLHSLWAGPSWPIHGFPPPLTRAAPRKVPARTVRETWMRLGGGGPTGGQAATARARLPNAGPPGALPKPQRNGWAVQRLAAYRGSHCVGAARVPAWPPRWSGGAQRWGGRAGLSSVGCCC